MDAAHACRVPIASAGSDGAKLGRYTTGSAPGGSDTALPGHTFGFAFDDIGNRKTATTNGRTATYTSNLLNQYTQRTVPGAVDVRGSASSTAAVIVSSAATNLTTTRTGRDFYAALLLNNTAAPVAGSLSVVMAGPGLTASGSVPLAREWRDWLLPQTPQPYTHDADGNLLTDGVWNRTYDAENRLVAEETHSAAYAAGAKRQRFTHTYDAQGRRVAKKEYAWVNNAWSLVADTRFLYDGWNLLAELDALNNYATVKRHVWGLDLSNTAQGAGGVGGLLFSTVATGADAGTYAPGFDGNGNIIAWFDAATGALAGEADFQPFGEAVVLTGVARVMSHGFSTKYQDRATGLLYYGYRFYDPGTGRWPNRDPLEEAGGLNLYAYCRNDGVNYFDPYGEKPLKQLIADGITGMAERAAGAYQSAARLASTHPRMMGVANGILDAASYALGEIVDQNPATLGWTDLGMIWLFELGNTTNWVFDKNSATTQDLFMEDGVKKWRAKALDQLSQTGSGGPSGPLGETVRYDQAAFYKSISSGNLTLEFLGSYKIEVVPKLGDCTIQFTVTNETGWASGTRFRKAAEPGGIHQSIVPNRRRGDPGLHLGGTINEEWSWTETMSEAQQRR